MNKYKIYYCIDCGKKLNKHACYSKSKRCYKCAGKLKITHGKTINQNYCKICNSKISVASAIQSKSLCRSCAMKELMKNPKHCPNYKTGYTLIKHYCIDCNTEIGCQAIRCMSCNQKELYKLFYKNRKIGTRFSGYYKNIYMKSSWEIKFAQFLDLNNIRWLYEPKVFNLGDTTYTPDFYLPELDGYIEIKGWWQYQAREKFFKFKKIYNKIKIQLLMKKDLERLGIL